MKIATMVRGYIPAPRPKDMVYAPIDLAVEITNSLNNKGHRVDYFGPMGTVLDKEDAVETRNLRPLVHDNAEFRALIEDIGQLSHYNPAMWDFYFAQEMFARARKGVYDILHFHHPEAAQPFVKLYPDVPVVYTLHDPIEGIRKEIFELYRTPNQYCVSISNNQRRTAPDLPYAATVYNGIDVEQFNFGKEEHDDFLLFTGRIVPEKGVKEAIQVAQQTDMRLLIIGPLAKDSQEYFDQHIKPHLNEKILYLGFIERDEIARYYQKAKAVLMPIQWEEPFGLTTIEAMACGTPVVVMRRGSMPEIVEDGRSGYIVDSVAEMVEAVKKVHLLHSKDCRQHVLDNFTSELMVDGYEQVYKDIIKHSRANRKYPVTSLRRISHTAKKKIETTIVPKKKK